MCIMFKVKYNGLSKQVSIENSTFLNSLQYAFLEFSVSKLTCFSKSCIWTSWIIATKIKAYWDKAAELYNNLQLHNNNV